MREDMGVFGVSAPNDESNKESYRSSFFVTSSLVKSPLLLALDLLRLAHVPVRFPGCEIKRKTRFNNQFSYSLTYASHPHFRYNQAFSPRFSQA